MSKLYHSRTRVIKTIHKDRYAEARLFRPVKTERYINEHPIMGAQGITTLDIVVGGCGLAALTAIIVLLL